MTNFCDRWSYNSSILDKTKKNAAMDRRPHFRVASVQKPSTQHSTMSIDRSYMKEETLGITEPNVMIKKKYIASLFIAS